MGPLATEVISDFCCRNKNITGDIMTNILEVDEYSLRAIISYLDPPTYISICNTCKTLNRIARGVLNPRLWMRDIQLKYCQLIDDMETYIGANEINLANFDGILRALLHSIRMIEFVENFEFYSQRLNNKLISQLVLEALKADNAYYANMISFGIRSSGFVFSIENQRLIISSSKFFPQVLLLDLDTSRVTKGELHPRDNSSFVVECCEKLCKHMMKIDKDFCCKDVEQLCHLLGRLELPPEKSPSAGDNAGGDHAAYVLDKTQVPEIVARIKQGVYGQ